MSDILTAMPAIQVKSPYWLELTRLGGAKLLVRVSEIRGLEEMPVIDKDSITPRGVFRDTDQAHTLVHINNMIVPVEEEYAHLRAVLSPKKIEVWQ